MAPAALADARAQGSLALAFLGLALLVGADLYLDALRIVGIVVISVGAALVGLFAGQTTAAPAAGSTWRGNTGAGGGRMVPAASASPRRKANNRPGAIVARFPGKSRASFTLSRPAPP